MEEELDSTQKGALIASDLAGFNGTNPQAIARVVMALADVLNDAGYSFKDIGIMLHKLGDSLIELDDCSTH
jgi:hypothetical protein